MSWQHEGVTLIFFHASAKAIWELVEVNRRVENKDEGYQRALSASRVAAISRFIDEDNILPTSVLISFDNAKLLKNGTLLRVPDSPKAGWVIDGQHRLAGAHEASKDVVLPVIAFTGLSDEEQINFFVTINREQKGVPSSLYYELLKHLPGKRTDRRMVQERAADLAAALKVDEQSPFYLRIVSTTSPRQGQISLTNFVRKVSPHIKRGGRLAHFSDDDRQKILNNLYRAVENVFPKEYKRADSIFFKTVGFGALLVALPTIMDLSLQLNHGFTVSDATSTLGRIDFFDLSGWRQRGTGTAAENAAANDLIQELTKTMAGTSDTLIKL